MGSCLQPRTEYLPLQVGGCSQSSGRGTCGLALLAVAHGTGSPAGVPPVQPQARPSEDTALTLQGKNLFILGPSHSAMHLVTAVVVVATAVSHLSYLGWGTAMQGRTTHHMLADRIACNFTFAGWENCRCVRVECVCLQVLDAPQLQDDFYLNLVDWSSQNVLAVGLGSCVYLWSACTSKVRLMQPCSGCYHSSHACGCADWSVLLIVAMTFTLDCMLQKNLLFQFCP